jgi:uncharacterized protein YbcV (DUF1398 family)
MNEQTRATVHAMTEASDGERVSFPEVVAALASAGVERYHTDLVLSTKTYYMPDGSVETVSCHEAPSPAATFSASGVEAAVRSTQAGTIQYREFCKRIADAGCVGYMVTLAGRRAVYYGRTGELHVEHFPSAK